MHAGFLPGACDVTEKVPCVLYVANSIDRKTVSRFTDKEPFQEMVRPVERGSQNTTGPHSLIRVCIAT